MALGAERFDGASQLLFVGPVSPLSILDVLPLKTRAWATLGSFNLLLHSRDPAEIRALISRASAILAPYEHWWIASGEVTRTRISSHVPSSGRRRVLTKLRHLLRKAGDSPEVLDALSEFVTTMASAQLRCEQVLPDHLPDLEAIVDTVAAFLTNGAKSPTTLLGHLTHLNAGLSRFVSQALSGTSPIQQTECHYWIHSLLGTGTANRALIRIASFAYRVLGRKQIAARLAELVHRRDDVPKLHDALAEFWEQNHLEHVTLNSTERIEPLITYFSGREGYSSHLSTLSAGTTAISSCNTWQWSLVTLTHEISHIVIRAVSTVLYPDWQTEQGRTIIADSRRPARNWLDALRAFLIDTVLSLEDCSSGALTNEGGTRDESTYEIADVLTRWYREVQELCAHVFDYLYFYGDIDRYLRSVWLSWSVIPGIEDRVEEYLLRSLCVATVDHLRRANAEDLARRAVRRVLARLADEEVAYARTALTLLSNSDEWINRLRSQVVIRKNIAKLTKGFLYWERSANETRHESNLMARSGQNQRRLGYSLKPGHLVRTPIINPARFAHAYGQDMKGSPRIAAWILSTIAFNSEEASDAG